MIANSNDEYNFAHKLLSTNPQVLKFREAFGDGSSADMKSSKTQLHKLGQSGGFLGRFLGPLLKAGLPLKKIILKPLVKNALILLGLTATATTDIAIQKNSFGSSMTILLISNEELNDIMKIFKSLEESGLLIKVVSQTTYNKEQEQKVGFFGTL